MFRGKFNKELCESTPTCQPYVPLVPFDRFGTCDSHGFQHTSCNQPGPAKQTTHFSLRQQHDLKTSSSDSTSFRGTTTVRSSDHVTSRLWSSYVDLHQHTSAPAYSQPSPKAVYLREKLPESHSDIAMYCALNDKGRGAPLPKHPTCCGTKRKMPAVPAQSTAVTGKKQKLVNRLRYNLHSNTAPSASTEEERLKKMDVRREKQKRRRQNNTKKYGDMYRLAFTCAFCKYRTFDDKDIETHFEGASHSETLDYIRKHAKYDEEIMTFLHESMLTKFQKMSRQLKSCPKHTSMETPRELMGVTEEDYMRKVEMVHCAACETHLPAFQPSVQLHLKSTGHLHKRMVYKEQLRRASVLTASSILQARSERAVKGGDPLATDTRTHLAQTQEDSSGTEEDPDHNAASHGVGDVSPNHALC